MIDADLLNGSNLSFIGDAYYELYIRKYVLTKGITNSKELHNECVKYVSAGGHHLITAELTAMFTEREMMIFKRGRNSKSVAKRGNVKLNEYLNSSGFEAVIGYLYLKGESERLDYLINEAIGIIEGDNL